MSNAVTKIFKKFKVKGVWGVLEARHCLQRQSFTGYFRQALVFMWYSALRGELISAFRLVIFTSADRIFISAVGNYFMKF